MTQLIAFCGLKGSGKDTAAGALIRYHGYGKLAFADTLKEMLGHLLVARGCGLEELPRYIEGDLKETSTPLLAGKTPRHAMQTLGTEWARNQLAKDFWVSTFQMRCERALDAGSKVVVTDCRFPNEVDVIRKLGGKVYRIWRSTAERTEHESERHIPLLEVDGEIDNLSTTAGGFEYFVRQYFDLEWADRLAS